MSLIPQIETLRAQSAGTTLIRVDNDSQLAPALALLTAPVIALDTETTGLDPMTDRLLLLQFSDGTNNVIIDMTRVIDWVQITDFLKLKEHLFIAHNAKFDYGWL